jgi:hypothetical protein
MSMVGRNVEVYSQLVPFTQDKCYEYGFMCLMLCFILCTYVVYDLYVLMHVYIVVIIMLYVAFHGSVHMHS